MDYSAVSFTVFRNGKQAMEIFFCLAAACNVDRGIRWLAFNDADEVVFAANV